MDFQHDIPPLGSVIAIKCAPLKMFYYFCTVLRNVKLLDGNKHYQQLVDKNRVMGSLKYFQNRNTTVDGF